MEDAWLTKAKRLHAIASTGLNFTESEFDRERYEEIAEIATQMLADLSDKPLNQIEELFPSFGKSYATPMVDVRAAIIRDERILLVKEKLDGLWTLPGGYADVGLSAGENAIKEVHEESGLEVAVHRLIGVFHKAKHAYRQDPRDFYKFYFLCNETTEQEPIIGPETTDVGFFSMSSLPPLSLGRSIQQHIEFAFDFHKNPDQPVIFD